MNRCSFENLRKTLEDTEFPFKIIGAVGFGSVAREETTALSDTDLLVVAEGIHNEIHRRSKEIICIKHYLPGLALDLLLLTPREVESNFRNHNPLFLDIADEGIILLDTGRFLGNLMEETCEYIKQKGIKKIKGGWIFPVERGVPTYLSEVSNRDFAVAMLRDGERDFLIGNKLIDEAFYDKAVYHFQQAVEKCIKSILISIGTFQRTHFVGEILRESIQNVDMSDEWEQRLLKVAEISEGIEPEVSRSRYPSIIDDALWLPFEAYEKVDADEAMKNGSQVLDTAREFLDEWFSESSS
jgi:HEPN domain-containing protein/predicted nucleotidyltransferase